MPKFLLQFLLGLSNTQANELWLWLDGNPNTVEDMVATLVSSHPEIDPVVQDKVLKQEFTSQIKTVFRALNR